MIVSMVTLRQQHHALSSLFKVQETFRVSVRLSNWTGLRQDWEGHVPLTGPAGPAPLMFSSDPWRTGLSPFLHETGWSWDDHGSTPVWEVLALLVSRFCFKRSEELHISGLVYRPRGALSWQVEKNKSLIQISLTSVSRLSTLTFHASSCCLVSPVASRILNSFRLNVVIASVPAKPLRLHVLGSSAA